MTHQSELDKDALIEDLAHENARLKKALLVLNGGRILIASAAGSLVGAALTLLCMAVIGG